MQNGDAPRSFSQPGLLVYPDPLSHSHFPPGLILPTQLVQNQIHELAKTLPPPRKQNTACDACRFVPALARSPLSHSPQISQGQVQPHPRPGKGASMCPLALAAHTPFISSARSVQSPFPSLTISSPASIVSPKTTPARGCYFASSRTFPPLISFRSHYVQQATSEKKRNAAARRPRGISTSSRYVFASPHLRSLPAVVLLVPVLTCTLRSVAHLLYLLGRLFDAHRLIPSTLNKLRNSHSPTGENCIPPWHKSAPWNTKSGGHANISLQSSTPNLLFHLFAPPESGPRYDRSRIHGSPFIPPQRLHLCVRSIQIAPAGVFRLG